MGNLFTLRPYQDHALTSTEEHLRLVRSTLCVMATGLGKAVVLAELARRQAGRVLIMAHLDELVGQLAQTVHQVTGVEPDIEMADQLAGEHRRERAPIVVGSVQTLMLPRRQQRFDPAEFSLVITDEAHHATGKSYQSVYRHFLPEGGPQKHVGFTATPRRKDQQALGQVFETVAFQYGIESAVDDGYLVPVQQKVVRIEGADFSKLSRTAGDLNLAELEEIVTAEGTLYAMAKPTIEMAGTSPTIVFCASVKHAFLAAKALNSFGGGHAEFLAGEKSYAQLGIAAVDKEQRRAMVRRFKEGGFQFLCLCQLGTEGFDAPATATVAMWRLTLSAALYEQMLGRGTRPHPSVAGRLGQARSAEARRQMIASSPKPFMQALDFKGNSGKHKIIDAADVLGGKWDTIVRDHVRETAPREGWQLPLKEAMERGEAEVALLRYMAREREKRAAVAAAAAVDYTEHEVSPFGGRRVLNTGTAERPARGTATDKQVNYLVWLGCSRREAEAMSKGQAGAVINKLKERREQSA